MRSKACSSKTGYLAELEAERTIEAQGRIENLAELVGVAREFDENLDAGNTSALVAIAGVDENTEPPVGMARVQAFLEAISLVTDMDGETADESMVTLMTLHSAKGLEFPVVFLTGLEDGIFPHMRSLGDPEALEEERRLCYVGHHPRPASACTSATPGAGSCSARRTTTRRAGSWPRSPRSSSSPKGSRDRGGGRVAVPASAHTATPWSRPRSRPAVARAAAAPGRAVEPSAAAARSSSACTSATT